MILFATGEQEVRLVLSLRYTLCFELETMQMEQRGELVLERVTHPRFTPIVDGQGKGDELIYVAEARLHSTFNNLPLQRTKQLLLTLKPPRKYAADSEGFQARPYQWR